MDMQSQGRKPLLEALARRIRRDILISTTVAGSGHPTSCLSAVELLTVLMFGGVFRADLSRPSNPTNDRLIFSKGHAAPLLYAVYGAAGKVSEKELKTLRKFGSRLEGHPMPVFPYTEVPTGSLGQGLSAGVGMAIAAKLDRLPYRSFVLLGDSEVSEGSVWEAVQLASFRKLDNLIAILDASRLGQSGPTMVGHNVNVHARRFAAFGWNAIVVDGHDLKAIQRAYRFALARKRQPSVLIAKTIKGKGVSFLENRQGWHGKALSRGELVRALKELGSVQRGVVGAVAQPSFRSVKVQKRGPPAPRIYPTSGAVAVREALGKALVRLAPVYPAMMVLDGEVKNSTYTDLFEKKFPNRFLQCYIAEQNMVGIANGLAAREKLPVVATFAAFLTRSFDQLRMASYAGTHQVYIGTHAGVSIGQDGPSQMGLEDIAMFRSLQNSTVLNPADAVSAERLLEQALKANGIVYIRATRPATPVLYKRGDSFRIGGSMTLRSSPKDRVTIVASGITVFEALKAADELAKRRIATRVIDLYSVKPVDAVTLKKAARQTEAIIVVEDHHEAGGVGEAVRSALGSSAAKVVSLAVRKIPKSGRPDQLLRFEGIDARAIIKASQKILRQRT